MTVPHFIEQGSDLNPIEDLKDELESDLLIQHQCHAS